MPIRFDSGDDHDDPKRHQHHDPPPFNNNNDDDDFFKNRTQHRSSGRWSLRFGNSSSSGNRANVIIAIFQLIFSLFRIFRRRR